MDPQVQDQTPGQSSQDNIQVQQPTPVGGPPAVPTDDTKEQIVKQITEGKNVLVTVGTNPSVDELASALGLTLLLGKLDKHVTAVFSGDTPPAIEFLDPEVTFENTVDSLRDFIIALSKEKADKLRYKVEDDVVKIFITPYKTIIGEKDLEFSQGDFNVDVVIALGVEKSEELDKAITAHGRILHDASVVTINAGSHKSSLGTVNWNDEQASSIAEMLVALAPLLGNDLLDEQTSTALLTGIVAETNRFSNERTTPKVMTISAQLMAAGANQQLVATNLRQEGMISESLRSEKADQPHDDNGEMVLEHEETTKNAPTAKKPTGSKPKTVPVKAAKPSVSSESNTTKKNVPVLEQNVEESSLPEVSKDSIDVLENTTPSEPVQTPTEVPSLSVEPVAPIEEAEPVKTGGERVIEPLPTQMPSVEKPPLPDLPLPTPVQDTPPSAPTIIPEPRHDEIPQPSFGGTLNATTADAEEVQRQEATREATTNNFALNHDAATEISESDSAKEAVEDARRAVMDAGVSPAPDFIPEPVEAPPLPEVEPAAPLDTTVSERQQSSQPLAFTAPPLTFPQAPINAPTEPVSSNISEEPDPMSGFMPPQTGPGQLPNLNALNTASVPSPTDLGSLPPLPPLPAANLGSMPPLPPLPGQPTDPSASFQPQINPEFMQDMPQSVNTWTQAGDDVAAKQVDKADQRQAKMDQMNQQYDTAVDRNRELQGLPPINDPNGSGLPPLPPV